MNKDIFAYIFVALLICSLCCLAYSFTTVNAQEDITVDGADYQSTELVQYPESIPSVDTSRIVLEYEDYSINTDIQAPDGLTIPTISRIIVEYADLVIQRDIASPQENAGTGVSRIVIEYADYSKMYEVNPFIGPQPMGHNDTTPPEIGIPTRIPSNSITDQDNVTVLVSISDIDGGVKNSTLQYNLNNSTDWIDVPMTINMTDYSNSLSVSYYGVIPNQSNDTSVNFRVTATDYAWNTATRDGEPPYSPYQVVPEFPSMTLVLLLAMLLLSATILARKRIIPKLSRPD
jgi:hypothetical protein